MKGIDDYSLPSFYLGGELISKEKHISYPAKLWYDKTYKALCKPIKSPQECQSVTRLLLEDFLQYSITRHITDEELTISMEKAKELQEAVEKIKEGCPIQYVLGYTDFAGHRFHVNPSVLIPRPETEEMTAFIIETCKSKSPKILDIGTGSGCIAITLAKAFPNAAVTALDISPSALEVARQNGKDLNVNIRWWEHDLLGDIIPKEEKWDLIVSNPPYIPIKEKKSMEKRVTAYEPYGALFVPQETPLIFYKAINQLAKTHLSTNGCLYLEVHEDYANAVEALLCQDNTFTTTLHKDIHGKKRWIEATR